jgi:hypothetical protein
VAEIKSQAVALLAVIADDPHVSLDAWVSGTPTQQTQVVQVIFQALVTLYGNAFHDVEKFGLYPWSQRLRFPDEAVCATTAQRHGATCVDFALLACAVLADCGLNPLFIMVGTAAGICHAMVGYWLSDASAEPSEPSG